MGASCDPSRVNQSLSVQLAVWSRRTVWQWEKGCNLCLIPLILESLLIIGSSFHHLANPEPCHSALRGSWGVGGEGVVVGCGGEGAPSGVNWTHTLLLHISSFRSIKEKEITTAENRSGNTFSFLRAKVAHYASCKWCDSKSLTE